MSTGEYATLEWKPRGNGKAHVVTGKAFDSKGIAQYKIEGKWDEKAELIHIKSKVRELIW